MQLAAEGRGVGRDHVERHGGHRDHQGSGQHDAPIDPQRAKNLRRARPRCARLEFFGLLQGAAQPKQKGNDRATDEQRHAPAPRRHLLLLQCPAQEYADQRCEHHGDLLAARLPADIETLVARRGDFRQVDRDGAQLHPRREALQQPPTEHHQRRDQADTGVARRAGDRHDADGHEAERQQQAGAPSMPIGIGAEYDGAQRPHEKAGSESHQRQHQGEECTAGRKESLADRRGVVTEDHEVIHLQEISAGDAYYRPDRRLTADDAHAPILTAVVHRVEVPVRIRTSTWARSPTDASSAIQHYGRTTQK